MTQRHCEACRTPIWGGSRRRFCVACSEQRIRDSKTRHELVRSEYSERLHPKYRQGVDLSPAEIERIIQREAQIKRQTNWRPEGWTYGWVRP